MLATFTRPHMVAQLRNIADLCLPALLLSGSPAPLLMFRSILIPHPTNSPSASILFSLLSASGNLVVDPSELKVTGQPKMYQTEGLSGGEVYRYFCGTCGS
jgi:hypothetical protein